MDIFEFQTKIEDGIIKVPEPYKDNLLVQENVRVIVIPQSHSQTANFLHYFLDHPLDLDSFTPLKRV